MKTKETHNKDENNKTKKGKWDVQSEQEKSICRNEIVNHGLSHQNENNNNNKKSIFGIFIFKEISSSICHSFIPPIGLI